MKTESELLYALYNAGKEYAEFIKNKNAETIPSELGCLIAFQLGGLMNLLDKANNFLELPDENEDEQEKE